MNGIISINGRDNGFKVCDHSNAYPYLDFDFNAVRDAENRDLRRQAIWAIRHPNKKMPIFYDAYDWWITSMCLR